MFNKDIFMPTICGTIDRKKLADGAIDIGRTLFIFRYSIWVYSKLVSEVSYQKKITYFDIAQFINTVNVDKVVSIIVLLKIEIFLRN